MNPDVAITIILGGEVALVGIAGGILTWHAARLLKDFKSAEKLNRTEPRASRGRPPADYEAATSTSSSSLGGGQGYGAQPGPPQVDR
jgi:hypothetical protein